MLHKLLFCNTYGIRMVNRLIWHHSRSQTGLLPRGSDLSICNVISCSEFRRKNIDSKIYWIFSQLRWELVLRSIRAEMIEDFFFWIVVIAGNNYVLNILIMFSAVWSARFNEIPKRILSLNPNNFHHALREWAIIPCGGALLWPQAPITTLSKEERRFVWHSLTKKIESNFFSYVQARKLWK